MIVEAVEGQSSKLVVLCVSLFVVFVVDLGVLLLTIKAQRRQPLQLGEGWGKRGRTGVSNLVA